MFPAAEVTSSITVSPGDSVTALVAYSKATQKFQMTVTDNNNGQHFSVTKVCGPATCKRSSAEVISEAPSEVSGTTVTQLPLADYGAESFASVAITNTSGFTGGFRSARWGAARVIQVGATSGNVDRAAHHAARHHLRQLLARGDLTPGGRHKVGRGYQPRPTCR